MNQVATFHIPTMDCPDELALIERGLQRETGTGALAADYLSRRLRVTFDPQVTDPAQISAALTRIGFPGQWETVPRTAADARATPVRWSVLLGGALLLSAAAIRLAGGETTVLVAMLAIAATIAAGIHPVWAAWRAIRLGALDMNVLMTIAATGAAVTGDYFEAATAMFLFGISLWLESFSLARANRAIHSLVELTPQVAHRVERRDEPGGTLPQVTQDVDPALLAIGDVVLVKPGERIPIDGVIVAGASAVNQAPITGESAAIEKATGESVFAGTLNGEGSLEIRATRTAESTTLAQIGRLIDQARASRAPTERFVDQFARRYTPAVIALAVLLAVVPPLLASAGVAWAGSVSAVEWLHRGLVLLVIACPCALVISTPLTIVCGLYQATRHGLLIKGGQHLEAAGQVDSLALDKTGTLTTGQAEVVRVEPADGFAANDVLRIAAALESHSDHPWAAAIVRAAREQQVEVASPSEFLAVRGFGVQATLDGETYFVGSERLFEQDGFAAPDGHAELTARVASSQSGTVILVGSKKRMAGALLLADRTRDDAAEAIGELKRMGIAPIVMLTGDHRAVAENVAATLGVDRVYADLLPGDKVTRVRELAGQYPRLAMAGDGVNDAPALAAAKLGIALGSQASDAALETADVVVMAPRLTRLVELFRLGRRTRQLLTQNIALALGIKTLVLVLAALGIATMWMAVAADVGASLLVIANGMRLVRK